MAVSKEDLAKAEAVKAQADVDLERAHANLERLRAIFSEQIAGSGSSSVAADDDQLPALEVYVLPRDSVILRKVHCRHMLDVLRFKEKFGRFNVLHVVDGAKLPLFDKYFRTRLDVPEAIYDLYRHTWWYAKIWRSPKGIWPPRQGATREIFLPWTNYLSDTERIQLEHMRIRDRVALAHKTKGNFPLVGRCKNVDKGTVYPTPELAISSIFAKCGFGWLYAKNWCRKNWTDAVAEAKKRHQAEEEQIKAEMSAGSFDEVPLQPLAVVSVVGGPSGLKKAAESGFDSDVSLIDLVSDVSDEENVSDPDSDVSDEEMNFGERMQELKMEWMRMQELKMERMRMRMQKLRMERQNRFHSAEQPKKKQKP